MRNRSDKPIIHVADLVKKWRGISDKEVFVSVNNQSSTYPANVEFELDYPEWEALYIIGQIKVE